VTTRPRAAVLVAARQQTRSSRAQAASLLAATRQVVHPKLDSDGTTATTSTNHCRGIQLRAAHWLCIARRGRLPIGACWSIMPTKQATQGECSGGRPPTTKRQRAA
jgi:hypothetical protein